MRDEGPLKSALARPRQHLAYAEAADIVQLAAVYTAGIVRNHPVIDGDKRIALVVGILFPEIILPRFTASEEAAGKAVLALAAGEIDEDEYATFLRTNVMTSDAEP